MTANSAWFPLYIGDYQADTMHLTCEQHGAYFLLMMAYYRRGRALPDDNHYLAGVVKASGGEWRYLRPVMAEFFQIEDGLWHHKRIDAELAAQTGHREARSERARANANKRWQKQTKSTFDDMPLAMPPADELGLQKMGGLIDKETAKINGVHMLLSQETVKPSNEGFSAPSAHRAPARARRAAARPKKQLSPIEGIFKGFADALAAIDARDGGTDQPANGALLDGAGTNRSAPDHC